MSLIRLALGTRFPISSNLSKLQYSSRTFGFQNISKTRSQLRTPIRFQSNRARDPIEQQIAINVKQSMPKSLLFRPLLFTVGISAASFVGVTVWEYEYVRSKVKEMMSTSLQFYGQRQKNVSDMEGFMKYLTEGKLGEAWKRLSYGDQFFIPICALNALIFALWRIPRLQKVLLRNFSANPIGGAPCRSMLLSTFSHYSFFHIFANMYVLHSFSNAACVSMGKEQTWAVYLSAGVIASYASYVQKVFSGVSGASLGASGAILGILAYICTRFPDTQLQIMFLPMFKFSAENAILCIMAVDVLGIAFGWKFFDHAAHLGGALFGVFWCQYGEQYLWPKRKYITEKWHEFRTKTCN